LSRSRTANIRQALKSGWKLVNGYLEKGTHKRKVPETVPNNLGAPNWNPRTDAVAVKRFGAVFVSPGRYLLRETGLYMDKNGCLLDTEDCPVCGSNLEKGIDYRFWVRVVDVRAPRLEYTWTHCSRCVGDDELASIRSKAAAYVPNPTSHRR